MHLVRYPSYANGGLVSARAGGASMIDRRIKRLPQTVLSRAAALPLYYICSHSYQEMPDAPGNLVRCLGWKHLAIIAWFPTSDNRRICKVPGHDYHRHILFIH